MDYIIVYDLAQAGIDWSIPAIGCVLFAVGLLIIWLPAALRRLIPFGLADRIQRGFGFFPLLASFIAIGVSLQSIDEYFALKKLEERGQFKTIEGTVQNFRPMPAAGHSLESFDVRGIRFGYSDFVLKPGFKNTAAYGGPIREGLPVRIAYSDGTILRLAIRGDSVPSPSELSAYADRQRSQLEKSRKESAPLLGFLAAAAIVTLRLNFNWQRYAQIWRKPPYTQAWEHLFRGCFLVSFLGVVVQLGDVLLSSDLARRNYLEDALVFGVMICFFAIFDGVLWWKSRRAKPT